MSNVTPPDTWRLICTGHNSGAWNMAVDETLFESVLAGTSQPVLRIYGWQPPAVSLGYFQPVEPGVNLDAIRQRGYDLVRRPTGGRAIIHHHEVTYGVMISAADLSTGASVTKSYKELSRGVEMGLSLLGISAKMPVASSTRRSDADKPSRSLPTVCFARVGGGDMVVDGRKIVGSAQMRRGGVILQHGSIPLKIDLPEHLEILGKDISAASDEQLALRHAAFGVTDALGFEVTFEQLGLAVVQGFRSAFKIDFIDSELTVFEHERAEELVRTRYSTDTWNLRPASH